ncbi:MAG: DUF1232 domain-containing protein [Polyangiales bacterium]
MSTLTANLEERLDKSTIQHVQEEVANANGNGKVPESTATLPQGRISRFLEEAVAKRWGHRNLVKLAAHRGQVASAWRDVPQRMHLVANQTKLMLELVDDFRSGTYRQVPWHSLAVCAAAVLYAANPADLIPDMLLWLGFLDDLAVAAIAAQVVQKDLRAYCEFKGYDVHEYFPA